MKNNLYNMIASIKNGQISRKTEISHVKKKNCEQLLRILWDEGFILGYKTDPFNLNKLKIFLKYTNGQPLINSVNFISKPGRKIYYSSKQIWKLDSSKNFVVFSTNKGLKTINCCKKLNLGGEPLIVIN
jgi:small subunit ribosomal protein S8